MKAVDYSFPKLSVEEVATIAEEVDAEIERRKVCMEAIANMKANWEPIMYGQKQPPVITVVEKPKRKRREFVDYHKYINSKKWKGVCKEKMKAVGYKCELCGSAMNLQVHHITYERLGHEELDDLLVVCKKCHEKLHEEDIRRKGGH